MLSVVADLIHRQEYKLAYGIAGDSQDAEIDAAITAASDLIQTDLDRELAKTSDVPASRRFEIRDPEPGGNGWMIDLCPWDARQITSVTLDPDGTPLTVSPSDRRSLPTTARWGVIEAVQLGSGVVVPVSVFGVVVVEVTGTWGFPGVPEIAQRACIETVRAWTRRDPGAFAGLGNSDEPGAYRPVGDPSRALPMAALRLLDPLRRFGSIG